ncbi:MAG: TolC family protein [Gammaproteobacteria bacterium]
MYFPHRVWTGVGLIVLAGCVTFPDDDSLSAVRDSVDETLGKEVVYRHDEQELIARVDDMLADELTLDEAVRIGLLYNRNLQAQFEELGIARANVAEAAAIANPVFGFAVLRPSGGGSADLDFGLVQSFVSIVHRPSRKRLAESAYEASKLATTAAAISLAGEIEVAYRIVQTDLQLAEMLRQVVDATGVGYEAARRLYAAGNITRLDLNREHALYEQARLALDRAELQVLADREAMNRLMGLWGERVDWQIVDRLPPLPEDVGLVIPGDVERRIVETSLELQMRAHRIDAVAQPLGIADRSQLIPSLEAGVGFERDDGERSAGLIGSYEIPLFNQGQGRVAAAEADLMREQNEYWATGVELRSVARAAHQELLRAHVRATHARDVLVPLTTEIVNESQRQFNAMQIGVFELLNAKRQQIDAGVQYIETLRSYWIARSRLQQFLNGVMPDADPQASAMNFAFANSNEGGH